MIPLWMTPFLVELGTWLVKKGVETIKERAEKSETKVDDNIVSIVDKVVDKVVEKDKTKIEGAIRSAIAYKLKTF